MYQKESFQDGKLQYFHPNRTQPFLITFFQAIMAFKRIFKMMKMRIGFIGKSRVKSRRRPSLFRKILKQSAENAEEAKVGKTVFVGVEKDIPNTSAKQSLAPVTPVAAPDPGRPESDRAKAEFVRNHLALRVANFRRLHPIQGGRVEVLAEKLDKMMEWKHDRRADAYEAIKPQLSPLQSYFRNFAHSMLAEEFDEGSSPTAVVEYLRGSSIYFGATIALQVSYFEAVVVVS